MKVMLLLPPKGFSSKEKMPPLGLAYIAAVLEKAGQDVKIVDATLENYSWNQLREKYRTEKPNIIGITTLTEFRFEAFKAAKLAKEVLKNSTVVLGGPHTFFTAQDTLEHIPHVDVVVRGEGEYTLLELCEKIENNLSYESVSGISYRENGEIVNNQPRELIKNLDEIPFPAYHLLKFDEYNYKLTVPERGNLKAAPVITSRGCPFHCIFCETSMIFGRKWRARSAENIIKEIKLLKNNHNVQAIWFNDDTFTMSKKRIYDLCDLIISEGLDISFTCSIRVDTVDKDLLQRMKEAGCYKIFFGVESGSQEILDKVVRKKITIEQIRKVSRWTDELGIIKNPSYVVSFPDESYEDALKTLQLMKEIGGEPSFSFLKIYPGTDVEKIAREKGIIPENFSWSLQSSMKNTESLPAIQGNAPLFRDKLTWEQILDIALQWSKIGDYPLIKRIPSTLKSMRSKEDLRKYFSIMKLMLRNFRGSSFNK